ncbi:diguanylate cyclase (GGDEF) domain-containing protein [Rhizobium sp. RU35A]|uniref:GGDEF domain-containing protein n=1 Tax=Rhizobium sp. RU35A TaxID=1907414 RepID=UPI000956B487|nr:GGDEF domain-containing protein [Rhizobium sp. RU35A]SIQ52758.1 diguanylate cyclase (GGDEF) domain-containing protein [Rhizobium sp. RU35A]
MTRVVEQAQRQAVLGWRELHAVLDLTPTALFWASLPDLAVRAANSAFIGRFGALNGCFSSIDEWLAAACSNPEHRQRARALWQALAREDEVSGASPAALELDLRCADGTIVSTLHRVAIDRREGVAIATFEDISHCKAVEHALRRVAHEDPLTELANRRALAERWQFELRCLEGRTDGMLALILLDLDRFKQVNDDFGHEAGDEVLKAVADRLREAVPPSATICRLGGDEFAILLSVTREQQVEGVTRRICDALRRPHVWRGHQLALGVSVGIASSKRDGSDLTGLMRRADAALYRHKRSRQGGLDWSRPAETRVETPVVADILAFSRLRTV